MVRALAFHQCDPGSIPGLEFVVDSRPCSERFFSGCSSFPSPLKLTFPNSNLIWHLGVTGLSLSLNEVNLNLFILF